MRLHHYTTSPSYLGVYHHHGHGFGSVFARLFSKVAAKTAARTAMTAAKVAGKKVLKVAAKQGVKLGKKALNEGLKQAKELGTDLAMQGIQKLENAAINKGVSPELVHNVSSIAKEGAHKAINRVGNLADSKVNKLSSHIDARVEDSDKSDFDESQIARPIVKRTKHHTSTIPGGSKLQNYKRRKRKLSRHYLHPSKRVKFTSLQNAIEES